MYNQSNRPVDWIEEKVKHYKDKLFRTALAVVGSNADAEDIVQEVFVKLFQKQPHFESSNHETAWLIRVTINLCKNYLHSHWWRRAVPLLDTHPAPEGEQQDTMQAVLTLPTKYRTVIHLYYFEGYTTKEIAEITGQKESAVRQHLTRARLISTDARESGTASAAQGANDFAFRLGAVFAPGIGDNNFVVSPYYVTVPLCLYCITAQLTAGNRYYSRVW